MADSPLVIILVQLGLKIPAADVDVASRPSMIESIKSSSIKRWDGGIGATPVATVRSKVMIMDK